MRLSTGTDSAFARGIVHAAERHEPVELIITFPARDESHAFTLGAASIKEFGGHPDERTRLVTLWKPAG